MKRRIMLDLAEDTTATHCGSCPHLALKKRCVLWGYEPHLRDANGTPPRHPQCLAAERSAANMVEIAREDAATAGTHIRTSDLVSRGSEEHHAVTRVVLALRKHGGGV